jgi:4'-phosphopantetheinyl transferase
MQLEREDVLLLMVDLEEVGGLEMLMPAVSILSRDEREVLARYRVEHKKVEFLVGRLLIRRTLGQLLGVLPERIELVKGEQGKLFLAEKLQPAHEEPLFFNLSHTSGLVVCGFALGTELGVDVEETTRDHLAVMPTVFTEREILHVERQEQVTSRLREFYRVWTRKEAYMKSVGLGFSLPPLSFEVPLDAGRAERDGYEYWTTAPTPRHLISTALPIEPGLERRYRVVKLEPQQLLDPAALNT